MRRTLRCRRKRDSRNGVAWLEILLGLAVVILVLQMVPSLGQALLYAADFRNWPRTVWFAGNAGIVVFLLAVRFGPDLLRDWRERRERLHSEHDKAEKTSTLKKQREAIERMKESRRRRMY